MNSTAALRIFSKSTIDVCRRSCLLSPSYPLRRFVAAYKPPSTWPHARTSIVDGIHHAGSIVPSRRHLSTATQWKENESQSENKSKISSFPPWSPESSLAEAAASGKETIDEKCIDDWQFERYRIFNRSMLSTFQSPSLKLSVRWAYNTLGVSPTATQQEVKDAFYKLSAELHPDSPDAAKKFEQLWKAYSLVDFGWATQQEVKDLSIYLFIYFLFAVIMWIYIWKDMKERKWKDAFYKLSAERETERKREIDTAEDCPPNEGPSSTRDEDRMSDEAIPNIDPEISNESYLRDSMWLLGFVSVAILLHR